MVKVIIEVKNVSKSFKDVSVLNHVNLKFQSGKIYSLVGSNGSGKSVLLKLLCGFYEPTEGEILQDGVNYIKEKKFPMSTRCLIEKPCFLPELSGFKNLKLLASIQNKISDQDILDALETVHLTKDKDKKYGKYSLGMKQKLGIAQVLMEDPTVFILDEPFNGIEKESTKRLRNALKDLAKKDKIIIIASHMEDDINGFADEIYEFNDGSVMKRKKVRKQQSGLLLP